MAERKALVLAVGDHVRLKSREGNQYQSYRTSADEVASYRESIDGVVLSIRDIKRGALVGQTKGALDQYVVEVVYTRSFNPRFASTRNAPRGVDDPTATAAWRRLRATLRKDAGDGKFYATAGPQADSPLSALLDGWKVVKIWGGDVESLEKPESPQEAPAE